MPATLSEAVASPARENAFGERLLHWKTNDVIFLMRWVTTGIQKGLSPRTVGKLEVLP